MKNILVPILVICSFGCSTEDQSVVDSKTSVILTQLTNGINRSKIWRITKATLKSSGSNELTITSLANVKDDELIFSNAINDPTISLIWRIRNDIRMDASKEQDCKLDYYRSAIMSEIEIGSNAQLTTNNPNLSLRLLSEDELTLLYKQNDVELNLILEPELNANLTIPLTLPLTKIAEVTGKGLDQAAGFTGSMASNSLYLAFKLIDGDKYPERIIKYDLANATFKTQTFEQGDFASKELRIINDKLKVVGAKNVNTYSLELDQQPISIPHNMALSRFGTTVLDDKIYLFGGNFLDEEKANSIYQHDQLTNQLTQVGTLPEKRFWAHGEMVDGKLYIFGGRQSFVSTVAEDDILVWDSENGITQSYKLPDPLDRTFTSRLQHYIFVAGQKIVEHPQSNPSFEIVTSLGVFNTRDNTYSKIQMEYPFTDKETIYGLTMVGSDLYFLVGTDHNSETFSILKTSL